MKVNHYPTTSTTRHSEPHPVSGMTYDLGSIASGLTADQVSTGVGDLVYRPSVAGSTNPAPLVIDTRTPEGRMFEKISKTVKNLSNRALTIISVTEQDGPDSGKRSVCIHGTIDATDLSLDAVLIGPVTELVEENFRASFNRPFDTHRTSMTARVVLTIDFKA